MRVRLAEAALLVCGLIPVNPGDVLAQEFYAGKTINITVGSAPGGGYDAYARLEARHLGRHVPGGPSIVVKNLPGAASFRTAQYIYSVAVKDGTELAALLNTVPITLLLDPEKFDVRAENFTWLGTAASPANVLAVWHTAGVRTVADAKRKEVTIGSTTPGTTKEIFPLISNYVLGTKFKVVNGYGSEAEVDLAMERGEIEGNGAVDPALQKADWLRDQKVIPLFQVSFERAATMQRVPTLLELAETPKQRAILEIITTSEALGRPLVGPPGLPAGRTEILRSAFKATVGDPDFISEAKRIGLEIGPTYGDGLQAMVEKLMATPTDIVGEFKRAVTAAK